MHPQQEEDPLERQFRAAVQERNTYLESVPRHRRSRSADSGLLRNNGILGISPKKLLSSLQQCRSPCSVEGRAAPRTGKIEGRSLLEALETAKDDVGDGVLSPVCSASSSSAVLIQQEDSCSCSCLLSSFLGSDSSSSLASLCQGEEAAERGRRSNEERWVVHTIRIFVAVWMAAVGIILAMAGFWGEDECGECVTPT